MVMKPQKFMMARKVSSRSWNRLTTWGVGYKLKTIKMAKQAKNSVNRLYIRISTLFIGIPFVFAAITLYISVRAANNYAQ